MVMHDFSIDAVQRCARLLRCTRAMTASLLVTAVSLGGTTTATGQTTATWLSPVSGSWTDASKWSTSPTYPRNGQPTAADIYDVVIDATGSAYTVSTETLGFDFTLNSLTLNSPDATVYFENY